MATKSQEMQRIMRHFKEVTGKKELDLKEVVKWAVEHGWPLPEPIDPYERLARDFASAAREEIKHDSRTGRPYRVNHAYTPDGSPQARLWVDIDEAPRKPMLKSAVMRREQTVGDLLQLTLDLEHWNRVNEAEEPIVLPNDLTMDVEIRKNVSGEDENAV